MSVRVKFSRGSGLGTRLFPWARCVLHSINTGEPMLAPFWLRPAWRQFFLGGVSRSSSYLHQIMLAGVFQPRPGEYLRPRGGERIFEGVGDLFASLTPHRERLLTEFTAMTRPRWRVVAAAHPAVIGVNIRLGRDFRAAKSEADFFRGGAILTPLDWFHDTILQVRSILGSSAPVIVVSDGTRAALQKILALENAKLVRPGCAASDLLALANVKVLIGSGGSSFSAWASYFSGALTVTISGQSLTWFQLPSEPNFVGVFDPRKPDGEFLRRLEALGDSDTFPGRPDLHAAAPASFARDPSHD
jgi:hypothetical protein